MTNKSIVIVEDEKKIAQLLVDYLERDGFQTQVVSDGAQATDIIRAADPTFVILDLMLPGKDGLSICREVRQFSNVPIMMLTARVDEIDRLLGLELGADDYVCKPFLPREVIARIHAILRRTEITRSAGIAAAQQATTAEPEETLCYRNITLYPERYHCQIDDQPIELTPVEFRMLNALMSKPGRVYSRDALMDKCYTDDRIISDRTIDSHLKNLRRKISQVCGEELLHSVYGVGYKIE
jgi:two-component system response regulator BaeR